MRKLIFTILILCLFASLGLAQPHKSGAHKNTTLATLIAGAVQGDIIYWDGTAWVKLNIGSNGEFLTTNGSIPNWGAGGASADSAWNIITLGNDVENADGTAVFINATGGTGNIAISGTSLMFNSFQGYTFDNATIVEDSPVAIFGVRSNDVSVVADQEVGRFTSYSKDTHSGAALGSIGVFSTNIITGAGDAEGYMVFSTANAGTEAERMRIDKDGNTRIGQSAVLNENRPSFSILGDALSAGSATSETFTISLIAADPATSSLWRMADTQGAGLDIDMPLIASTLTSDGKIFVDEVIEHFGDANTTLSFFSDQAQLTIGGTTQLNITPSMFKVNASSVDSDFLLETANEDSALVVDGADGDVFMEGLGSGTGTALSRVSGTDEIVEQTSSKRFKKNIKDWDIDISDFMKLQPRQYTWNENSAIEGRKGFGMIAEEVLEIAPEVIVYNGDGEVNTWCQETMIVYLTKVVQNQQKQIDELKKLNGVPVKSKSWWKRIW